MTPEERQLISDLFDRMRNFRLTEKDSEAENLINQSVRALPDAPYMLVQSVLVQEQALRQAEARIQDLEQRMRDLEGEPRAAGSGGFLGGLFGGGRPEPRPNTGSVPSIGSRAGSSPYGGQPPSPDDRGPLRSAQAGMPGGGGGFMRSAMATAAGVAGGMLLAESIRNMMGQGGAQASTSGAQAGSPAESESQKADDAAGKQDARDDQANQQNRDDHHQATDDTDYDSGGFGDLGGDLDI